MKSEILIWLCGVKELTSRGSCAYRLLVLHLPNAQVLQWDNSSGFFVLHKKKKQPKMTECSAHRKQQIFTVTVKLSHTHCGVLKVVQTVVCEDEPSPLPGFYSSPCGANSQHQRGSARKTQRERERRAPKHQVEQQTGRQMYEQTDRWRLQRTPFPTTSHYLPWSTTAPHRAIRSPSPSPVGVFSFFRLFGDLRNCFYTKMFITGPGRSAVKFQMVDK